MTIAQLIIILILAAAWPYALEVFMTWLQAAVPPPPSGSSQAYQLVAQVASFMSQNAAQLSIASILVTAIVVAWRGRG